MGEKGNPHQESEDTKGVEFFLVFFPLLILGPFIMPKEALSLVVSWVVVVEWMIQSRGL